MQLNYNYALPNTAELLMGIPKTTENLKKFISVIFMTMYKSLG